MAHRRAANGGETAVAVALAQAIRRKHLGQRVDELSMSAVGIISLLMLIGIVLDPRPYRWVMAVQIGLPWASFGLTWYFLETRLQDYSGEVVPNP